MFFSFLILLLCICIVERSNLLNICNCQIMKICCLHSFKLNLIHDSIFFVFTHKIPILSTIKTKSGIDTVIILLCCCQFAIFVVVVIIFFRVCVQNSFCMYLDNNGWVNLVVRLLCVHWRDDYLYRNKWSHTSVTEMSVR